MFKKLTLAGAALAMGAAALVPATPAMAQRYDRGYSASQYDNGGYGYRNREYRQNRNAYRYNGRNNYRASQKCADGDGGTIVGAIAGGLLGREVAGRGGDRTLGTILGGLGGALAGRAIDRSDRPNYCR
jgi:outer membrane lipoprotein SlyB